MEVNFSMHTDGRGEKAQDEGLQKKNGFYYVEFALRHHVLQLNSSCV